MNEFKGIEKFAPDTAPARRKWMTGEEIDKLLDDMDEEAIAEQIELERDIAELHRPKWWTFGIRTFIP